MSEPRISVEPHAPESLRAHVRDHLDAFNVAVTGLSEYHSVSVFLRDDHDEVLGGCLGAIWGGWLSISFSGSPSHCAGAATASSSWPRQSVTPSSAVARARG